MRDIYRNLNEPADEIKNDDLEGLTMEDVGRVLALVTDGRSVERTLNRLHNTKARKAGKVIQAFQLTGQGFEPMAHVELFLPVEDGTVLGQITNAVDIANGEQVAVTVLSKTREERTWLMGRDDELRVWKKEVRHNTLAAHRAVPDYDKVVEHGFLRASYIAEHLTTFFGKRIAIKGKGSGVFTSLQVFASEPDAFHMMLDRVAYWVHEDDLIQVMRTLEPEHVGLPRDRGRYPWGAPQPGPAVPVPPTVRRFERGAEIQSQPLRGGFVSSRRAGKTALGQAIDEFAERWLMVPNDRADFTGSAWTLLHNHSYQGATLQLGPNVKGVVTHIQPDNEGKLLFVIDGHIYKRNRNHTVKLWKKENNA